jgi:hypothetical protein
VIYCVLNIRKGVWVTLEKEHYWYEHVPKLVETCHEDKVTILRNRQLNNDTAVPNIKPDIMVLENERRTCLLIQIAISGDKDVIK